MIQGVKLLFAFNRLLCRIESFFLAFTLITMLAFASLQVILRNFFDTGIEWGDVFARHLVLWTAFFGATLATNDERHVRIDALEKVMPAKVKPLVQLLGSCFCIVVGFMLMDAAYKFMMDERMAATILFANVPTWYFIVIMPLGFAIITFRFFVLLVDQLVKFAGIKIKKDTVSDDAAIEISVNVKLP